MKLPNKQKGLSSIGWLFVGVTIFFYGIIATKIVPIYVDDITVQHAMEKLSKTAGASAYELPDVVNALETEFDINNIRDINLRKEGTITIDKDTDKVVAGIHYEKVATIFDNNDMLQHMDVVIRFKHEVILK